MKVAYLCLLILILPLIFPCLASSASIDAKEQDQNRYEHFHDFDKELLLGMIDPSTRDDFCRLDRYNTHNRMFVHRDVYAPLIALLDAAKRDNINLYVISAFRSFDLQRQIWNRKLAQRGVSNYHALSPSQKYQHIKSVLNYSAMPGSSRHHWGTDIDFCSVSNSFGKSQTGKRYFNWLTENAPKYGFFQAYNPGRDKGHKNEYWHWSYAPLASKILLAYTASISEEDFSGFSGSNLAGDIDIVQNYVSSVNTVLLSCYPQHTGELLAVEPSPQSHH